jgi:putative phosphonate metabolism protein
MSPYPRYALYYTPPRDSLICRFGAELLGYEAFAGASLPFPDGVVAAFPDWSELTREPRRYGFHATLKAPFALADGKTEPELITACDRFAEAVRSIPLIEPIVEAISGFVAIVPRQTSGGLEELAQACVATLDEFRAPMTALDRARRNPAALTPRQLEQLDRWGYPYVGADFRFHMTLTGRLPAERSAQVVAMLRQRFSHLALTRLAIDRIALFRQDTADACFRIIEQFELPPQH